MKNISRLLAMLLALVLMMGVCVTTAQADTCYEIIKLMFEDPEDDTFVYLGEGTYFEPGVDGDRVYFIANVTNGYVGVTGINDSGELEGYAWLDPSEGDTLLAFCQFCMGYDTLCEYLDDCDELAGGIYLSEDGDPIIVSDSESADNFVQAVKQWLEED